MMLTDPSHAHRFGHTVAHAAGTGAARPTNGQRASAATSIASARTAFPRRTAAIAMREKREGTPRGPTENKTVRRRKEPLSTATGQWHPLSCLNQRRQRRGDRAHIARPAMRMGKGRGVPRPKQGQTNGRRKQAHPYWPRPSRTSKGPRMGWRGNARERRRGEETNLPRSTTADQFASHTRGQKTFCRAVGRLGTGGRRGQPRPA